MEVRLPVKSKRLLYFGIVLLAALVLSLRNLYYSCPAYDIERTFSPLLYIFSVIMDFSLLTGVTICIWGCMKCIKWVTMKSCPVPFCRKMIKNMRDEGGKRHILLHLLLFVCNILVQLGINELHFVSFHFSLSLELRILDTLIGYVFMLMLAFLYLKVTKCNVQSVVYYAVVGILPCIMIAWGIEWLEFSRYEYVYCSDFGMV